MLYSAAIIEAVAAVLADYPGLPLVLDPVFAATSGSRLIKPQAIRVLCKRLFPLAALVTPNVPEAEFLCSGPKSVPAETSGKPVICFTIITGAFSHERRATCPVMLSICCWMNAAQNTMKTARCSMSTATVRAARFSAAIAADLARGLGLAPRRGPGQGVHHRQPAPAHDLRPGTRVIDHFFRPATAKRHG